MVQNLLPPLRSSVPAQSKLSIQANLAEGSRHEGDSTAGPSGDKRKKKALYTGMYLEPRHGLSAAAYL